MNFRAICAALILTAAGALAQEPAPAPAPSGVKTESLPSAEQVLIHYVEATGGAKAHEGITSQIESGSFSIPASGITAPLTIYQKAPDKMYTVIDIPNVGKIEDGSNGKIAWEVSAVQGARIKAGDEAAAALRQAAMDLPTNWKKYYKSVEVQGTENVGDKTCYKLLLTPVAGSTETQYFDKDAGFLVKVSSIADTPMGKVPTDILLSDYQKQGDVFVSMKQELQVANQDFVITTSKVTFNADIPDSRFDLPAEIKALQK